jgi:hypothetical protein
VQVLLGKRLGGRLDPLILLWRHEVARVLWTVAAVRACHNSVVRKRLPLLGFHLEEPPAVRASATEESLIVRRDRHGRLEAPASAPETGDAVWKSMLPAHAAIQASSCLSS